MRKTVLFIILLLLIQLAQSQTSMYDHVKIHSATFVYKDVMVKKKTQASPKNVITIQKEEQYNGRIKTTTETYDSTDEIESIETIRGNGMEGKCNILAKEKVNDRLFVNYWFYRVKRIKKNAVVRVQTYKYEWDSDSSKVKHVIDNPFQVVKLKELENCYAYGDSLNMNDAMNEPWFIMVEKVFEATVKIEDEDGKVTDKKRYYFYFGSESDKYYIKIENRQSLNLAKRSWDFGAITIPIKMRLATSHVKIYYPNGKVEKRDAVYNELATNPNVGFFFGPTLGRYSMKNNGESIGKFKQYGLTIGMFGGMGGLTLDSNSTRKSIGNLKGNEKSAILFASLGFGGIFSVRDLNFSFLVGKDFGIGQFATRWNYDSKPWVGIGVGYNIGSIWKRI